MDIIGFDNFNVMSQVVKTPLNNVCTQCSPSPAGPTPREPIIPPPALFTCGHQQHDLIPPPDEFNGDGNTTSHGDVIIPPPSNFQSNRSEELSRIPVTSARINISLGVTVVTSSSNMTSTSSSYSSPTERVIAESREETNLSGRGSAVQDRSSSRSRTASGDEVLDECSTLVETSDHVIQSNSMDRSRRTGKLGESLQNDQTVKLSSAHSSSTRGIRI